MQASDKLAFSEILNSTFAMNPKWQMPNSKGIDMWWRCLEQYTIEQVAHGFEAHLTGESGRFQPMPADVITAIIGSRRDRSDVAAFGWQRVLDALGTHGTYQTVAFDDPAIHWAIKMTFGNWPKCGQMTEDELPFRRKDFIESYTAYRPGLPIEPRLIGITETRNSANGIRYGDTAYIGDTERAKAISEGEENSGLSKPVYRKLEAL